MKRESAMKRIISILVILLLVPFMISAGFGYRFDILSLKPLYREYTADRDRAGMDQ